MRLGYVIAYVADVDATIEWWEGAFGLGRPGAHRGGSYGELDTGATTLSFASHEMGKANLPGGFVARDLPGHPRRSRSHWWTTTYTRPTPARSRPERASWPPPSRSPGVRPSRTCATPTATLVELCSPMA